MVYYYRVYMIDIFDYLMNEELDFKMIIVFLVLIKYCYIFII